MGNVSAALKVCVTGLDYAIASLRVNAGTPSRGGGYLEGFHEGSVTKDR